jgi:hypothetical protein
MKVHEHLYSDHFTRKTHVAVLFHGDKVLGLCTANILNLHLEQDLDDSYFKVWPETVMNDLRTNANSIMTCCNATLNFEYRQNKIGMPGLDLVFGLLVMYLKSTNVDAILGTPRLEKGVEKSCYRTGAVQLAKNIPYTTIPGQNIDLVCWWKNLDLSKWDPELLEVITYIWNRNTIIHELKTGDAHAA